MYIDINMYIYVQKYNQEQVKYCSQMTQWAKYVHRQLGTNLEEIDKEYKFKRTGAA